MANYEEYLAGINREAYHAGEDQWEEDGYTVTRTYHYSPPGCHNSCGLLYYVKDGIVEKVEGDPLDPFANGHLCMRCLNRPEAINHPDRLKYPMKRAGERGENKWERITWEEAFDTCEREIRKVWEEYGGQSILGSNGTARNVVWQLPYLFHAALKTPNVCHIGFTGYACYLPRTCGTIGPMGDFPIADASEGHELRYSDPDWCPPEIIVVWANEPLASNADSFLGHWLVQCVQMGSKIISIDPRLTWWGARAHYHIQLRPGTDAALACAWLNVIIEEDLIDHEFVNLWATGLEELAAAMKDKTPAWAADICGVPEEDIVESARMFASANAATIQWGVAMDQQPSVMSLALACVDLMTLTGNIDVPGGWLLVHNAFNLSGGMDTGEQYIPKEWMDKKATSNYIFGTEGKDFIFHAGSDPVLKCIETGEPYPIMLWWAQSTNELSCPSMDAARIYKALNKIPFIVVADPYMTPTAAALADIVLPVSMSAERDSARTWWTPARTTRKVSQYYECKTDEEIIVEIGRRLNPEAFPWDDAEGMLNWFLTPHKAYAGYGAIGGSGADQLDASEEFPYAGNLKGLQKVGYCYDQYNGTYRKYEKGMLRPDGKPGFNTPTGRIELVPIAYRVWGLPDTPDHVEPPRSPISSPEYFKEYPVIITAGGRSFEFFHSEDRQEKTMREFHPQPLLTMHPKTAEKYGIKDGEWVWVENDQGRFRQIAYVRPTIREDCVHAEHGWWFPEQPAQAPYFFGTFDSNYNTMTRSYETGKAGVGNSIKADLCKIYPYKEGDTMPGEVICNEGGFFEIVPGQFH